MGVLKQVTGLSPYVVCHTLEDHHAKTTMGYELVVGSGEHELGFTQVEFDVLLRHLTEDAKDAGECEPLMYWW